MPLQSARDLFNQVLRIERRVPPPVPIIENNGQNRRQPAGRGAHTLPEKVLVEEAHIRQDPHRHRRVDRGLELQQQVDIDPALLTPAEAPDHVALPLAEVVADIAVPDPLQRGEVSLLHPLLADEALDQVRDEESMREQQLVSMVVVRQVASLPRSWFAWRQFLSRKKNSRQTASRS